MPFTLHTSRHTFARGFTLVEILIAMTLLSLVLLLVFSSLHAAGRNWEISAEQIEMTDEIRLASQFIRKNLAQTVPLIWVNEKERKIAFAGKSDEINFVVPLPAHRGGGGLSLLTLKTSEAEEGYNLMLYYRMAVPERQSFDFDLSDDEINSVALAEAIDSIEFSYFGSEDPDMEPVWHDDWNAEEQLPLLVRLKIYSAEQSVFWPELVIAIHPQVVKGQSQFYQTAATR